MEAVLPQSINYLDTLPKAIPSERKRRNFFAANGTQYRPGQTIIIEVQDTRAFLDTQSSFLRFTLTNQGAGDFQPEFGGGYACIRNFRVQQAGNTIMNIQEYSRLYNAIIGPVTGGRNWKSAQSVYQQVPMYGNRITSVGNTPNAPATPAEADGALFASSNVPCLANALLNTGESCEYCVPLIGGLFSQSKLIPLPMLNQPIQLIFDLHDAVQFGVYTVEPTSQDMLISNVRYCAEMVEVPRDVLGFLASQQAAHGGSLVVAASSYEYQRANLEAGATGTQILEIPSRKKSIKSIQFVAMADSSTIAQFANAALNPGTGLPAGSSTKDVFSQSCSANPCLVSYQLRAGSMVIPPTAIQGPGGRNAGNGFAVRAGSAPVPANANGVGGLPNAESNKGESAFELSKAFGHLGSTIGMGACNRLTYANPEADGGGVSVGTNWIAGQGSMTAGLDVIAPATGIVAGGLVGQWNFCPFALDLEAYQNQALNSGIDTKSLSLQMQLHLVLDNTLSVPDTGAGGLAAAGGQSSPINFDIYSYHDILYYFNSDGTITFSD
tara:strand:- start:433 stop:2088 length:1656 start_codon:yes stop_codon:yes gene_type:complete